MASLGGKARWKNKSKKEKKEHALKMVKARLLKKKSPTVK